MKHRVSISQLSNGSNIFLNVDADTFGHVKVTGSAYGDRVNYLLRKGINFDLIQFENPAYADEWFADNPFYNDYEIIDLAV